MIPLDEIAGHWNSHQLKRYRDINGEESGVSLYIQLADASAAFCTRANAELGVDPGEVALPVVLLMVVVGTFCDTTATASRVRRVQPEPWSLPLADGCQESGPRGTPPQQTISVNMC